MRGGEDGGGGGGAGQQSRQDQQNGGGLGGVGAEGELAPVPGLDVGQVGGVEAAGDGEDLGGQGAGDGQGGGGYGGGGQVLGGGAGGELPGGQGPEAGEQDWTVPIVYESAPLVLLRPQKRDAPVIRLAPAENRVGEGGLAGSSELPRPPDAGFFGRDETLLALDRAFDTQPIALLHGFAGAGKSATAAEFARWYQVTGGLDHPDHPEWGRGPVLWSSFEHHLTADRVIGTAGDYFAALLEANGIARAAVTEPAQRRDLVIQVLAQMPVLWVWDNVEPVTGFPASTQSDWTRAEQDDLAALLRDLVQHTKCKVLVTSRRDEHTWLGDMPARVQLPPMPMRKACSSRPRWSRGTKPNEAMQARSSLRCGPKKATYGTPST